VGGALSGFALKHPAPLLVDDVLVLLGGQGSWRL
jgi:hypothetical protein